MIVFGKHDENTLSQMREVEKNAEKTVLCADGHYGYSMSIGGVAAYKNKVSPIGVGFDIACGNKAVKLDIKADTVKKYLNEILDLVERKISFGVGQINVDAPQDHPLFVLDDWNVFEGELKDQLLSIARPQLGTVGSGNHYVDIFEDENGYVWVGVHFGSRGLGHKICTGFLNLSINGDWNKRAKEQECLLDLDTQLGKDYFTAMNLAGKYAYAGREWVCNKVAELIGRHEVLENVHNNHNFAWEETHFGEKFIVVRKGATPAQPGQKGFIGGSMGDNAVIVEGVDGEESRNALYSTVHGAGRVMSRTEAGGKYKGWGKKRHKVRDGKISKEMLREWLKNKGVKLRGAGLDEAPQAYRRLDEVLDYHKNTIEVLHTLKPLGVVMAGDETFDPYLH